MFQTHGKYYQLYVNARHQAWDPGAIDLTVDRDHWAMIQRDHAAERFPEQILLLCSLFAAGEQSVTETLSPFLAAMGRAGLGVDKELFLTSQVYDEARHFEFFARYFAEVLADAPPLALPAAPRAVLVDDLADVANRIRREDDGAALRRLLVEGVSHYMGVVEAMLARTGYRGVSDALASRGWLPGLREGFRLIRRDEGRHVSFGIHFVREVAAGDPDLRGVVAGTFERHLPNVIGTVGLFDYPRPIVAVDPLITFALAASRQFLSAAGLGDGAVDIADLEREIAEG